MSCEVSVRAEGLCKEYRVLDRPIHQLLAAFGLSPVFRPPTKEVIRGVDFTICKGEKVGILGINGAGKSTLLHMLAGMSEPSAGKLEVNGRTGAILELGAGFHPELSGRQNAETLLRLNGFHPRDLEALMAHVCDFAALGADIEAKTRTYSSGMLVRLAFAVATCGNPDIMIVDEALAVGDAAFQQKCFRYLRETLRQSTLILISHDMSAVSSLCDRAIILDGGRIAFDGAPAEALPVYNRIVSRSSPARGVTLEDGIVPLSAKVGPLDLDIVSASVTTGSGGRVVSPGDLITVAMTVEDRAGYGAFEAAVGASDIRGQYVFGQCARFCTGRPGEMVHFELAFRWPAVAPGEYSLNIEVLGGPSGARLSQCSVHGVASLQAMLSERSHGIFNIDFENAAVTPDSGKEV